MEKDLVSIITPCYNTGRVIHRLLDSILIQDYPKIEMYVVDDGSSDNSKEVILSYIPKFEKKGYMLKYLYQENAGQSIAVNSVLDKVRGEYLAWPDSDDYYYTKDSISTFVNELKQLDESFGLVRCYPLFIDEDSLQPVENKKIRNYDEEQFERCLYATSDFVWPPVSYMARMVCFKKANPEMSIYTAYHNPQNWQMLLPLLYSYKCFTLANPVSCVLVRSNSYSRGTYKTYEQLIQYYENFENILDNTLKRIPNMGSEDRDNYLMRIRIKYAKEKYFLSVRFNQPEREKEYYSLLKSMGYQSDLKERMKVLLIRHSGIRKLLLAIKNTVS